MKKFTLYLVVLGLLLAQSSRSLASTVSASIALQDSVAVDEFDELEETLDDLESDAEEFPIEEQDIEQTQNGDTTFINVANKNIQIIEQDGETQVKIKDSDKDEFDENFDDEEEEVIDVKKGSKFKGHWAGLEIGLNNLMDQDMGLSRSGDSRFLELNTGKSWNVNLNVSQYSLGFGTDRLGLVTGMGFEWNNYHFSDTNSIQKTDEGVEARPIPENVKKNRFQTLYFTIPLILELQFLEDSDGDRAYMGVGVIGGAKLLSNTAACFCAR